MIGMNNFGSWTTDIIAPDKIEKRIKTRCELVLENLVGMKYEIVLYCGYQVVNGVNYMLLCKGTSVTEKPYTVLAKVIINESSGGAFTIMSITTIAEDRGLNGAWKIADKLELGGLPQPVATGFSELFGEIAGASYSPVMYFASQIVSGTNHMILCKQTLSTFPAAEKLVMIILNQSTGNKFTVVSIDNF